MIALVPVVALVGAAALVVCWMVARVASGEFEDDPWR